MFIESIGEITYSKILPLEIKTVIPECAELYSNHYGTWSLLSEDKKKGNNIRLSAERLSGWLINDQTNLYVALLNNKIIGYAIALRDNMPNHGIVSWVTQFVVHKDYRNRGIGSHLLRHIWGMSNDYAWGLITANPYAVRALEKATRRICDPLYISNNNKNNTDCRADKLLNFADGKIAYINKDIDRVINRDTSRVNTNFAVDHSEVENKIRSLNDNGVAWNLGELEERWEWFAFTFRKQPPFPLDRSEITDILSNSEVYVKQAYRRMLGGIGATDEGKPYAKHTLDEVDFIIGECNLCKDSIIADFGCGNGRHTIELAKKTAMVYAIDYIEENIKICKEKALTLPNKPVFHCADCRSISLGVEVDAAICLYDVIGSFANEDDNIQIIKNITRHLKIGGTAIITVMNSQITQGQVKEFSFAENLNALFELEASSTMQKNGEVFNPALMLYDRDKEVFYRKEQFLLGTDNEIEFFCPSFGALG